MASTDPTKAADAALPPVQLIYKKLIEKFGQGDTQVFQMEFPARLLDMGTYDYPGSDSINAQQIKPQTVAEAEFRLSDDMYTLSNLTGGPNGTKLSQVYDEIIFGLIPTVPSKEEDQTELFHKDQEKISAWLLEPVQDWEVPEDDILADLPSQWSPYKPPAVKPIDPVKEAATPDKLKANTNGTISRIDLYQKLLDKYENERFRWATFKTNARPQDMISAKATDIDHYNRMLSTYAPIVDGKLETLWTLVLVRGQYHQIRRLLGYVDVSSAAAILQKAKESLRASVLCSIDDTEDIYPVYFSPATWARKLSTAFKFEDLLSDESVLRGQLLDKEKLRAQYLSDINDLKCSPTAEELRTAADAENAARDNLLKSRDKMLKGYSDCAIGLIQMYFDAKAKHAKDAAAAIKSIGNGDELNAILSAANECPLTPKDFETLRDTQEECIANQSSLQLASEALSRAQLAASKARSSDASSAIYILNQQIQSLSLDIDYLTRVLQTSPNATGKAITVNGKDVPADRPPVVPTVPALPIQEQDADIWTTITDLSTHSATNASTINSTEVSDLNWSVNIFFGSASGSNSKASSRADTKHDVTNTSVQIAFRCMKVQLNRPWLYASVLRQTREFCTNLQTKISGADYKDVKDALQVRSTAQEEADALKRARASLLPAIPISFIVVKDVHIILTADNGFEENSAQDIEEHMSAGGGILCFSCSKSQSSSDHRTSASIVADKKTMSIRIPAPQIIGWAQELTPRDESLDLGKYNALQENEFAGVKLPTNLVAGKPAVNGVDGVDGVRPVSQGVPLEV